MEGISSYRPDHEVAGSNGLRRPFRSASAVEERKSYGEDKSALLGCNMWWVGEGRTAREVLNGPRLDEQT